MAIEQNTEQYWVTLLEHNHLQYLVDSRPVIDDGEKKIFRSTPSAYPHGIRVRGVEYHAVELVHELGEIVAYVYDTDRGKRVVRLGAVSLNCAGEKIR